MIDTSKSPTPAIARLALAVSLIGTALAAPPAARADWNSTKWGMSLAEAQAAQSDLVPVPEADQERMGDLAIGRALLTGDYEAAGVASKEFYLFDDNVLTAVKLVLDSEIGALKVKRLMDNKYGRDYRETDEIALGSCRSIRSSYRSLEENNVVTFSYLKCATGGPPSAYAILYEPVTNPQRGGY